MQKCRIVYIFEKISKIKAKTMGTPNFYVVNQIGRKPLAAKQNKINDKRSEYNNDFNNSEPTEIKRRLQYLTKHSLN